ncbi:hypothetical protein QQS21_009895 [Conoideocrella luteorostrata]|uniref:Zn(2)-C6 fungal-type domain-containing protein n=1 Tax=Conoideocrella luteorostrata TaxID=1105319 RepID=A0AAJ0CH28_9HYPO|nr:hypothetical protein QQS21_009895 [Conoideocrella luteorostrata]
MRNRARRVKCGEEKPSCKRCIIAKRPCRGYIDLPEAEMKPSNPSSPDDDRQDWPCGQPCVAVSPAGRTAPREELRNFHYYHTEATAGAAGDINRTLWAINFPQAAKLHPSLWHACNAVAAVDQTGRLRRAPNTDSTSLERFNVFALKQHSLAIEHVLNTTRKKTLDVIDMSSILATNLLLLGCAVHRGDMDVCRSHVRSGVQLIREWEFWKHACRPGGVNGVLPVSRILMCYVQTDALIKASSPAVLASWHWENALHSLQSRPFSSEYEVYLELEVMWNGLQDMFRCTFHTLDAPTRLKITRRRKSLQESFAKWKTKESSIGSSVNLATETKAIVDIRKGLINVLLDPDVNGLEKGWRAFEAQFEELLSLIESGPDLETQDMGPTEVKFLSSAPTMAMTTSLQQFVKICGQPTLRRRTIALLDKHAQPRGGKPSLGSLLIRGAEMVIQMEEKVWSRAERDCECIPQKFVCDSHRVVDFDLQVDEDNIPILLIRCVDEIMKHDAPRRIPMVV